MMIRLRGLVAALLVVGVANTQAAEGSCGHNEMRQWVDNEEVCYHLYGPLNERWNLKNQDVLDTLSDCLATARDAYKRARFVCDVRGETPYREDRIHEDWERYRTAFKTMKKDVLGKP